MNVTGGRLGPSARAAAMINSIPCFRDIDPE
jgi:hypothetical protein